MRGHGGVPGRGASGTRLNPARGGRRYNDPSQGMSASTRRQVGRDFACASGRTLPGLRDGRTPLRFKVRFADPSHQAGPVQSIPSLSRTSTTVWRNAARLIVEGGVPLRTPQPPAAPPPPSGSVRGGGSECRQVGWPGLHHSAQAQRPDALDRPGDPARPRAATNWPASYPAGEKSGGDGPAGQVGLMCWICRRGSLAQGAMPSFPRCGSGPVAVATRPPVPVLSPRRA